MFHIFLLVIVGKLAPEIPLVLGGIPPWIRTKPQLSPSSSVPSKWSILWSLIFLTWFWRLGAIILWEASSTTVMQILLQIFHFKRLGREQVHFESDSKSVREALINPCTMISEFGSIIRKCHTILSSPTSFEINFVRRQANMVAHNLARVSYLHTSAHNFYVAPTWVELLITEEMQ